METRQFEPAQDLKLLHYLESWTRACDSEGPSELMLRFGMDRSGGPDRAAWVTAEDRRAFGQLTVWTSGAVEVDVYETATAALVVQRRLVASTVAELVESLSAFVAACVRPQASSEFARLDLCHLTLNRPDRAANRPPRSRDCADPDVHSRQSGPLGRARPVMPPALPGSGP